MKLPGPIAYIFKFSRKDTSQACAFTVRPHNEDGDQLPYAHKEVPFVHQNYVNLCGDACVNMVLGYHEKPFKKELQQNPRGAFQGIKPSEIIRQIDDAKL